MTNLGKRIHLFAHLLRLRLGQTRQLFFAKPGRKETAEIPCSKAKRMLVLAPHPDDEVIGCGGALIRHAEAGAKITCVYVTMGEMDKGFPHLTEEERCVEKEKELGQGARLLGVKHIRLLRAPCGAFRASDGLAERLAGIIDEVNPDIVYIPFWEDRHRDHIETNLLFVRASELCSLSSNTKVRGYEVWHPLSANIVIDITDVFKKKVKALRQHKTALHAVDYIRLCKGLNTYRAATLLGRSRDGYAEAFVDSPRQNISS